MNHHHHRHRGGGAAVLDIGGDIGALNVVLDERPAGTELYLRTADPAFSVHTGVWTRHVASGDVTMALFAELLEGTYWVLDADGHDLCSVDIIGGKLAELDLRSVIESSPSG